MRSFGQRQILRVNMELWLLLALFTIAAILNIAVSSHRMVLGFYALPTIGSAYFYGRRHATMTALASVLLVVGMTLFKPEVFSSLAAYRLPISDIWLDLTVWGGILIITGYAMGTLYEHKTEQVDELRNTYYGVLEILRYFLTNDDTENHCYRVSLYATRIASQMNLSSEAIEDVRAAAWLHDIGKVDISRDLLYKAARLTEAEFERIRQHVDDRSAAILEPIGGSLRRVLPIVLAYQERADKPADEPSPSVKPLAARIIAVADAYDTLTTDRPQRKAMSPFDAKAEITKGAGSAFDPHVVEAFLSAYRKGALEVPALVA